MRFVDSEEKFDQVREKCAANATRASTLYIGADESTFKSTGAAAGRNPHAEISR